MMCMNVAVIHIYGVSDCVPISLLDSLS